MAGLVFSSWELSSSEGYLRSLEEFISIVKFNSWLLPPLLLSLLQSVLSKLSESLFPPAPPPLGSPFILFLSAFCCAKDICCSGNIKGAVGGVSFVLFFLFFRLVLGVVTTLALFFPNTLVNVADVAEIPIVVVVVALGGSMGTSCSTSSSFSSSSSSSGSSEFSLGLFSSSSSCFLFCSSFFFFSLFFSFLSFGCKSLLSALLS